jgi:hypothetical protein
MDLILLTGLVEDRRISEELSSRLAEMESRIEKLEQR